MSNIGFFDLLGVTTIAEASALWPIEQLTLDPADVGQLVAELEGALSFQNLKPSASGENIGLTADVVVGIATPSLPVVFASLPKFEFRLIPNSSARLYVRQSPTGVEWIVEALPVQIALPDGLLVPIDPGSGDVVSGSFVAGAADTYDVDAERHGTQRHPGTCETPVQRGTGLRPAIRHAGVGRTLPILRNSLRRSP